MVVYLLAPDLNTLGGYEGQLAALAAGLAQSGQRVYVFFREPVRPGHPYQQAMLTAGVQVSSPPLWSARWLRPAAGWRRGLMQATLLLAAPAIALLAVVNALVTRRSWGHAWQGARGRLHGRLNRWAHWDGLTWRLEAALDRAMRNEPADVIDVQHSMLPQGIAYARRRGRPTIYTEYGAPTAALGPVWTGLTPVINQADFIIGRAEASLTGLREVCGATRPAMVVPNAVTTAPDEALTAEPPLEDGQVVVTAVGRLSTEKGPQHLLAAFQRLAADGAPARLVLAGEGPLRDSLARTIQAAGLGERVQLLGAFDDLAPVMRATHIFAHPTLNDGRSVSVLEAMAWGKPVIASATGGVPELVQNEVTGLLVPPGDEAALAAALRRLIDDAPARQAMGRAARARFAAGQYSMAGMVTATLAIYAQVRRDFAARKSAVGAAR